MRNIIFFRSKLKNLKILYMKDNKLANVSNLEKLQGRLFLLKSKRISVCYFVCTVVSRLPLSLYGSPLKGSFS